MKRRFTAIVFAMLAITLAVVAVPTCRAADKSAFKEALTAKHGLTKTSLDKVRVTEPAPVYVVKAENINADKATDMTMLVNQVID